MIVTSTIVILQLKIAALHQTTNGLDFIVAAPAAAATLLQLQAYTYTVGTTVILVLKIPILSLFSHTTQPPLKRLLTMEWVLQTKN